MKKSDLKYGNVVETREGIKYLYHCNNSAKFLNLDYDAILWIRDFDENLKRIDDLNEFDIMKVYEDYTCKELIWKRKEPKEKPKLTEDEKVILRNIDEYYKWIARDEDGQLWVHKEKPVKDEDEGAWFSHYMDTIDGKFSSEQLTLFTHLFQFISWEDDEPYLIEDLLNESEE